MDPLALIGLHLELECIGMDSDGQLIRIPCADPDTLHRVYAVRYAGGEQLFFRRDLPAKTRAALSTLPFNAFFQQPEQVIEILAAEGPCEDYHIGKSYTYPADIQPTQFPEVLPLSKVDPVIKRRYNPEYEPASREVYAVVVDGQVVSSCESSRENASAGEAWVFTREEFRGRGYARQAAAAWGFHLLRQGKTPFYSHKWDNLASQAVARSLKLILYVEDAGYA